LARLEKKFKSYWNLQVLFGLAYWFVLRFGHPPRDPESPALVRSWPQRRREAIWVQAAYEGLQLRFAKLATVLTPPASEEYFADTQAYLPAPDGRAVAAHRGLMEAHIQLVAVEGRNLTAPLGPIQLTPVSVAFTDTHTDSGPVPPGSPFFHHRPST
jgi:hypothetical protein